MTKLELNDYSGVIQTDGFKSYDTHLSGLQNITHAGCNVHAPPDKIIEIRKEKSLPIPEGLWDKMNGWSLQFTPTGNFGKAIRYFLNEYDKLIVFIEYPDVRPDTNLVENDYAGI